MQLSPAKKNLTAVRDPLTWQPISSSRGYKGMRVG